MYAKIKNGQLVQYPYGSVELQADNPYTNFNDADTFQAFQGTEENLAGAELVLVQVQPEPAYDTKTQKLVQASAPSFDGANWVLAYTVVDKTAEELTKQDETKAASVRAERDSKLAACDWRVIKAFESGAPQDFEWAAYRQALRDITTQAGFPWTIYWPTQP